MIPNNHNIGYILDAPVPDAVDDRIAFNKWFTDVLLYIDNFLKTLTPIHDYNLFVIVINNCMICLLIMGTVRFYCIYQQFHQRCTRALTIPEECEYPTGISTFEAPERKSGCGGCPIGTG